MRVRRMSLEEGAWCNIFQYPCFHKSGSVIGMKKRYYGKDALLVRCGDWIYDVPWDVYCAAN